MSGRRDPYADVGAATRLAIDRAMPGLTLPEARVLLALVGRLTSWSLVADRLALGQIVDATGMDGRAVRRAVRTLEARGAIGYEAGASPPGGRRVSSRFALPADDGPGVAQTGGPTDRGSVGPHTGGPHNPRNRGSTRPPSRELDENSPEDSLSATSGGLTSAATNAGESAFTAFWAAWPKKVAKADAAKAWKAAVKTASADTILDAARRHAAGHEAAGTDRRFIPHPATWLRGQRWEDDPPEASTNGNGVARKSADEIAESLARKMGLER